MANRVEWLCVTGAVLVVLLCAATPPTDAQNVVVYPGHVSNLTGSTAI